MFVLSTLLFLICMNCLDKLSRTAECVTVERCKVSRLFFADNLALLAFFESGLQHALNGFVAACDIVGMKVSTIESDVLGFAEIILSNYLCKLAECH